MSDLSYSAQYDRLFQKELDTKTVISLPVWPLYLVSSVLWVRALASLFAKFADSHGGYCLTEGIDVVMQPVPKPSKEAQSSESGAKKVLLSDVHATAKTKLFGRQWNAQDWSYAIFMTVVHGLCLLAPATFSWPMVGLFFVSYFITGALNCRLSGLLILSS